MGELLSELRVKDPYGFGYKCARSNPKPGYFLDVLCEGMSPGDKEAAIEGWNGFQEDRGELYESRKLGVS